MKKFLGFLSLLSICWTAIASIGSAELLVHYTFDDLVGSTVVDSSGGNQNAQIINNVSTGIPGVLGNAVRFPNDDGASFIRLPAANNPIPMVNSPRTIAFWFSQESVGAENKLFGHGLNLPGQSFDISLEGGGIRLRYGGGNVTWGNSFDFSGADAGFHHLAIRVPDDALNFLDVELLLDGLPLVGIPTGGNPGSTFINTAGGTQSDLHLGRSVGSLASGDFIGLMDDFRIYNRALTDNEVRDLIPDIPRLVLEVDPIIGTGAIRNLTEEAISIDYYEISSSQSAISTLGWSSLETQDRVNFPSSSEISTGWAVLGTAFPSLLAEGRLQGLSSLEPGEWINLGTIYDPIAPQNLSFTYGAEGVFHTSQAQFISTGWSADFDRDQDVDINDLSQWQASYGRNGAADSQGDGMSDGRDFLAWQRQYMGVLAPGGSKLIVPEPHSHLALFCIFVTWELVMKRLDLTRARLRRRQAIIKK